MSSRDFRRIALGLALFAGLSAGSARADAVSFTSSVGNEGLGAYTGTLTYSASSNTAATLSFSITNTSPVGNGGFLTGLVFNTPSSITGVTGSSFSNGNFSFLSNESAPPYGTFDFGAALGGDFTGGGSPNGGIAVGSTATFDFTVSGTGLSSLSATDIATNNTWLLARFKGFEDGGSDKVPTIGGSLLNPGEEEEEEETGGGGGGGGGSDPGPNPVPAPAGLVLGLIAFGGLIGRRTLLNR